MSKRMSLVVFSTTADKLTAVATLATGAAAIGMEVELFLSFCGLEAFGKGAKERPPPITAAFEHDRPRMIELMQVKRVPHWLDTLRDAPDIGNVKLFACSATIELFDMKPDDLADVVVGLAAIVYT